MNVNAALLLLPLALVVACASSPTPSEPPAPKEAVIARVNGVDIPRSRLDRELETIVKGNVHEIPADRLAAIANNVLLRLVEQALIDQAVERAKIVPSAAAMAEAWNEYRSRFQDEQQFESYLASGRQTRESVDRRIRERLSLEMLLGERMAVSREESLAFYEDNLRFYSEKAAIRASHILIKVGLDDAADVVAAAYARARVAQDALAAGEDFASVADRMSEGEAKGGDLGFFGKGRMVEEFEEVAFAMKVGEVSAPVRTRFGLHIIKLTDRRIDRVKPFEEVADEIRKSLANKAFFTERRKLIAELTEGATIETFLPPELQLPSELREPLDRQPQDD